MTKKTTPSPSDIPFIDATKREGSVLTWALDDSLSISRDTKKQEVLLLRGDDVMATFTIADAKRMGVEAYVKVKKSGDKKQMLYVQSIISASAF